MVDLFMVSLPSCPFQFNYVKEVICVRSDISHVINTKRPHSWFSKHAIPILFSFTLSK